MQYLNKEGIFELIICCQHVVGLTVINPLLRLQIKISYFLLLSHCVRVS